jgi:cellulose synthase/poly-beta-1,6-N-acetylglucosamine synthase-like glycosyltransferase
VTYISANAAFEAGGLAGGKRLVKLAEIVFWGSLALALYAYGLYPLLLWLLSRWARDPAATSSADDSKAWPTVTLLIAAQRDEHFIVDRLQNAVALDYLPRRLQIIVGCAGEEDLTGLLARSFDKRQVDVAQFPTWSDALVLNACVRRASGEILVFSDARTLMRPDAIRRLARHFRNPAVGGVCGKLVVTDPTSSRLLGRRSWSFENFLKRCECRLGALPEVDRGIVAIRKDLFVPLGEKTAVDNFSVALQVHRQGYRLLYDEWAVATAEAPSVAEELQPRRAMRTEALHSLSLLWPLVDLRRGTISFTFWLHRVVRRLCPGFLIAAFVSNACLSDNPFYLHCLLFHELFYVCVLLGLYVTSEGRWWRLRSAPLESVAAHESLPGLFDGISGRGMTIVATDGVPLPTPATR